MKPRTSRVHLPIPVFVYGYKESGEPFQEITQTVTINANGALVELETPVFKDQSLLMVNTKSGDEIACEVVTVDRGADGKPRVGIRFNEPSPHFWGLNFPPEDWDPADRKRPDPIRK
jgi:hypothetical protein